MIYNWSHLAVFKISAKGIFTTNVERMLFVLNDFIWRGRNAWLIWIMGDCSMDKILYIIIQYNKHCNIIILYLGILMSSGTENSFRMISSINKKVCVMYMHRMNNEAIMVHSMLWIYWITVNEHSFDKTISNNCLTYISHHYNWKSKKGKKRLLLCNDD